MESCPVNHTNNTDPGQSTALVEWQHPLATDNSGDTTNVVCEPPSGSNFTIGTTRVNCTAVDGYGNEDRCSFDVSITGKL